MKQHLLRLPALTIPIGPVRLSFGLQWLLILPIATWGLADYIIPLSAPNLAPTSTWSAACSTALILLVSLAIHALGHALIAKLVGAEIPTHIPIELYGDPAQIWPAAQTPTRDGGIAMAGPATSAILATIAAITWNLQINPAINAIAFLATVANAALALINIIPGYPLDGGRALRSVVWSDIGLPLQAITIGRAAGAVLMLDLAGWGIYLLMLNARFSIETGGTTLIAALLILIGQRHPAWQWPTLPEIAPRTWLNKLSAGIIPLVMLSTALMLLPMVDGLYAPGPAVSVGPMIQVPAERRGTTSGELLLTTVVAQTPITLGQWLYAKIEPAFTLVAPERVVPRDTTPQQLMRQNVQMLEESEVTAIVVGMRLANYQADLVTTGLEVSAVAPESPSIGKIQPGDRLVTVAGVATPRLDVLRAELAKHKPGEIVELVVERTGQPVTIPATLMPPDQPGGPPRIGIVLLPVGLDVQLAFPVSIQTQKIAGGPSAGLMFALAVYDALSPDDLTHGWKIAGTGTIALDGTVGPIGGIAQKVAGAEWAGADYFLVPREHESEARTVAKKIKLIPISTIQEALAALQALPQR
jgi:PDZ domain-containing protein